MPTEPPLPEPDRLDHFVAALVHCVEHCADHRADGHDVFLWNARRASEAILYALAEGTDQAKQIRAQSQERKPIDHAKLLTTLTQCGRLHPMIARELETMRIAGNLGAHAQAPEGIADATTLRSCLKAIPQAVEWFFCESSFKREMPESLKRAIADLRSDPPRHSPRRLLEFKVKEIESEAVDLRLAHESIRDELARLKSRASEPAPAPAPVVEPPARPPSQSRLVAALAAAAGIGIGFVSAAVLRGEAGSSELPMAAAPSVLPDVWTVPSALRAPVSVLVSVSPQSAAPANRELPPLSPPAPPTAAATRASASCPPGRRLIPAQRLHFARGPHPRPKWPSSDGLPRTVEVPAFCIDMSPPTTGEFRRLLAQKAHKAAGTHRLCNAPNKRDELPANCVSFNEADMFCAARAGRLPTIAEWETAIRAGESGPLTLVPDTAEWAHDTFPPEVFGHTRPLDGPEARMFREARVPTTDKDEPQFSWQYRRAAEFLPTLSFRCASDAATEL